jgi:aldehyde:ferredoxin oxidoreductase
LKGLDTRTQQALEKEHGFSGHRMSVYSIGPAGEHCVRFAAIQGDYGHVASKNGCGAVMGKKKLKAVCIVRGTNALTAHDARGLVQAADEIAHDLKTDPSTSTLYNWGTLPGVTNLYKLGVLPIKNYTTNLSTVNMDDWAPTRLRAATSTIAVTNAMPAEGTATSRSFLAAKQPGGRARVRGMVRRGLDDGSPTRTR